MELVAEAAAEETLEGLSFEAISSVTLWATETGTVYETKRWMAA